MEIVIIRWIILVSIIFFLTLYCQVRKIIFGKQIIEKLQNKLVLSNIIILIIAFFTFFDLFTNLLLCLEISKPFLLLDNIGAIITGSVLYIVGIIGVTISKFGYLKKNWSYLIEVFPEQNLIQHGPYRTIRHPIYFFGIFFYGGLILLFPSLLSMIPKILIIFGYIVLTKFEDDCLRKKLDYYKRYAKIVRFRFIPGIW